MLEQNERSISDEELEEILNDDDAMWSEISLPVYVPLSNSNFVNPKS